MQQLRLGVLSFLLVSALALAATPGVRVVQAWARATPPAAPVAGAYLTVVNDGDRADRLLRVESAVAERVEIHSMRTVGGMMRMREVTEGLVVPAHGRLEIAPGGDHLMLIGPKQPLREGGQFNAVLVFQHAGRIPVRFTVRGMGAGGTHAH